jgi:imidazolonepropionase-like amidohydrolase
MRVTRALLSRLLLTLPLALACGSTLEPPLPTRAADPASTVPDVPLVFQDVSIVPMTSNTRLDHQAVHVRNGIIEWIGSASAEPAIPPGATVIPGDGRVLMPALIDLHVHARQNDARAYVEHGIGTVRNMWGHSAARTLAAQIASGTRFGPTIISVSSGLDAPPEQWPVTQIVTTPDQARTVVAAQKALGYTNLKLYDRLTTAIFDTVMRLARENGMGAVGHVPFAVDVRHALSEGMRSIEHLTGYDRVVSRMGRAGTWGWADADETRYAELVQATAASQTWNCPTLAIYVKLSERHTAAERPRIIASRQRFVKALHDGGGRLLAGSDAGIDVVAPGVSLHDELDQFAAAGLTPYQALRAATVDAAAWLGRVDLGVIAMGARADLLLLAQDPLGDVRRARSIGGVVLGGAWTPQRELATRASLR